MLALHRRTVPSPANPTFARKINLSQKYGRLLRTILSKHKGKVQNFHGQTMAKNRTFSFSARFHCQNTLRFGKHIFMSKVDLHHFNGQSTKFSWTNRLYNITRLVGVVLSFSLRRKWVGREKGLAQYTSVVHAH